MTRNAIISSNPNFSVTTDSTQVVRFNGLRIAIGIERGDVQVMSASKRTDEARR